MQKINTENWTSTQFHSGSLRAFVSLGAAPAPNSEEVEIHYLVTLTDKDYQEIFQSIHAELSDALLVLNEKYGHWDMVAANSASENGCSDCAAH